MTTRVDDDLDYDDDLDDDEVDDDPPDEDDDSPRRSRFFSPRRLTIALGVVAALLVGTGAWALIAAAGIRDSPAARNDALDTYDKLFAEVRAKAPAQKLVLTTRVVYSAVQSLDGDRAQLFVFLDQSATRVDTNTTAAAAQLSITAKRENGHWVITDMAPR